MDLVSNGVTNGGSDSRRTSNASNDLTELRQSNCAAEEMGKPSSAISRHHITSRLIGSAAAILFQMLTLQLKSLIHCKKITPTKTS